MVRKEEIRKNIEMIGVNNVIEDYSWFVEVWKNGWERELREKIIWEGKEMILEYEWEIKRGEWKKDGCDG